MIFWAAAVYFFSLKNSTAQLVLLLAHDMMDPSELLTPPELGDTAPNVKRNPKKQLKLGFSSSFGRDFEDFEGFPCIFIIFRGIFSRICENPKNVKKHFFDLFFKFKK